MLATKWPHRYQSVFLAATPDGKWEEFLSVTVRPPIRVFFGLSSICSPNITVIPKYLFVIDHYHSSEASHKLVLSRVTSISAMRQIVVDGISAPQ